MTSLFSLIKNVVLRSSTLSMSIYNLFNVTLLLVYFLYILPIIICCCHMYIVYSSMNHGVFSLSTYYARLVTPLYAKIMCQYMLCLHLVSVYNDVIKSAFYNAVLVQDIVTRPALCCCCCFLPILVNTRLRRH